MLSSYTPFIVIGLTVGSVYGIAAMGLVLTYKTSGLFNIGHGAIAALGAYIFFTLRQEQGLPWPLALVVAVVGYGFVAGLVMERLAAALSNVPPFSRIVATVGLLVGIRGLLIFIYGPLARQFRPFLPTRAAFQIGGVNVSWENVITLGLGALVAALLYLTFRRSLAGIATRAVVDDAELLDLTGESPVRVRRRAWVVGCVFAAGSGVLFAASTQQLDATLLSLLVVQAFGAAAIGAFTSLPLAYLGGLAIGLLQSILAKEIATHPSLQGLDTNISFIILFGVLLLLPRGRLKEVGRRVTARAVEPMLSPRFRQIAGAMVLALAIALPSLVGTRLPVWTAAMAQITLFLSLGLLVRTSGQISLCQVGFAAVGASTFGHAIQSGAPWLIAVGLAALVAIPVGALISLPAIRLSGLYLGLATFGFGILLAQFFYTRPEMFDEGLRTARPHVFGLDGDEGYYYLLLGAAIAAVGLVALVERSRLGRLLRGLSDSPLALSTLGTSVSITRVIVFCLSASLAAISGALVAGQYGSINGDAFPYVQSLVVLAVLVVAGRSTIVSAVLAAVALYVVPGYVTGDKVTSLIQCLFGGAAVIAAVLSQHRLKDVVAARPAAGHSLTRDRLEAARAARTHRTTPDQGLPRPRPASVAAGSH